MTNQELKELRFWERVNKDAPGGCWIWASNKTERGYGRFRFRGKETRAHRFSYEIHYGPIPEGMIVCHDCPTGDNPACVNPAHLWLGTHQDNMDDMVKKGRQATGERHSSITHPERLARGERNGRHTRPDANIKLTPQDVIEIRNIFNTGNITYQELANRYNVTHSLIGHVVKRRIWKHI